MSEPSFEAPARWNQSFLDDFVRALGITGGRRYTHPQLGDNVQLSYRVQGAIFGKRRVDIRPLERIKPTDGRSFVLKGMVLTTGSYEGNEITVAFRNHDSNAAVVFGGYIQDGPFAKLIPGESGSLFA